MSSEPNGWDESAKLVFSELNRLSASLESMLDQMNEQGRAMARVETKLDTMQPLEARVRNVEKRQERLEVKSGLIATIVTVLTSATLAFLGIPPRN